MHGSHNRLHSYHRMMPFTAMSENAHGVDEPVEIVPHDSEWSARFQREKAAIQEAFGVIEVEVHHIGSTAVPGLAAKPIVDILVAVESLEDRGELERRLSPLGYSNVPYDGCEERLFFRKGVPRTHHVHVVKRNSQTYRRHLLFRDILASDPELRAGYERLKLELATMYRNDREAYSNAKTEFIERALAESSSGK